MYVQNESAVHQLSVRQELVEKNGNVLFSVQIKGDLFLL